MSGETPVPNDPTAPQGIGDKAPDPVPPLDKQVDDAFSTDPGFISSGETVIAETRLGDYDGAPVTPEEDLPGRESSVFSLDGDNELEGEDHGGIEPPFDPDEPAGIAAHLRVNMYVEGIPSQELLQMMIRDWFLTMTSDDVVIATVSNQSGQMYDQDAPGGMRELPYIQIDCTIVLGEFLARQAELASQQQQGAALQLIVEDEQGDRDPRGHS